MSALQLETKRVQLLYDSRGCSSTLLAQKGYPSKSLMHPSPPGAGGPGPLALPASAPERDAQPAAGINAALGGAFHSQGAEAGGVAGPGAPPAAAGREQRPSLRALVAQWRESSRTVDAHILGQVPM